MFFTFMPQSKRADGRTDRHTDDSYDNGSITRC